MKKQIKATKSLSEIINNLKNILSWIGLEINDWLFFYSSEIRMNDLNVKILDKEEFVKFIKEQKISFQEIQDSKQRPDDIYAFMQYLENISLGDLSNSGLCIITSHFYQELLIDKELTAERLIEKINQAYDGRFKIFSLSYDNGLPYIGKGVNVEKIKFLIGSESP